tara:strand:+ start:634 stop:1221 length:588 start_codon:yes stop_codon:yes gene_type:complete
MKTNITYKNKQKKNLNKNKTYNYKDYNNNNGMLTSVWGPSMWHYLHTISFNYPVNPTNQDITKYRQFLLNLQYTLPCKYCRTNLQNNFKKYPLKDEIFTSRNNFSRYIYNLHEIINKMLGKTSGLSYCDVRDRYENFRSRCTIQNPNIFNYNKLKREKGCTTPLYGKKAKCIIKIVPQEKRCKSLTIDKKCIKYR